jgi:hypothetical protein
LVLGKLGLTDLHPFMISAQSEILQQAIDFFPPGADFTNDFLPKLADK